MYSLTIVYVYNLVECSYCNVVTLIIAREVDTFKRLIREAIEIHCQTQTINQDNGYKLLLIYWEVYNVFFYHPNHVTKRQTPSLDEDSMTKSNACALHKFLFL